MQKPVTKEEMHQAGQKFVKAIFPDNSFSGILASALSTVGTNLLCEKFGIKSESELEPDTIDTDYEVIEEKVNRPKQLNIKCKPVQD